MRLLVPFPGEWPTSERDGAVHAIVPGHAGEPDLIVVVSAVRALPPVIDAAFLASELGVDLPAGGEVQIEGTRDDKSARGWPVTIVRARVTASGRIIEQRLAALYRLIDQFAAVVVIGRSPERWNQLAPSLGDVVLAGDLDWSGPQASLAEIFELGPDHPIFRPAPPSE
jgi:hypothetical protein